MKSKSKNTLLSILENEGYSQGQAKQIMSNLMLSEQSATGLTINSTLKELVDRLGEVEKIYTPSSTFTR